VLHILDSTIKFGEIRDMEKQEKHTILKRVVVFLAVAYLSLLVVVGLFQRRMIFHPSQEQPHSAYAIWETSGTQIGWKNTVELPKHIWLFLHGNTGNALTRDYIIGKIPKGDSLFALEYPGYGVREGTPSMQTVNAAADEAFTILRNKFPGIPIIVVGESIGSGPACILSRHADPPEKIILAVPFDTFVSVAQDRMPLIPAKWMLVDRWDNIDALRGYKGRLEIFAAADDKVIRVRHARRLYKAYPNAVYHELEGVEHKNWWKSSGILSPE
jgi:uncharacterized protein